MGGLGVAAALFFGAALAHWVGEYGLVLSARETTLRTLRRDPSSVCGEENVEGNGYPGLAIPTLGGQHTPADFAVMLGPFAGIPSMQGVLVWPFLRFHASSDNEEMAIVLRAYYDAGLLRPGATAEEVRYGRGGRDGLRRVAPSMARAVAGDGEGGSGDCVARAVAGDGEGGGR